MECPDILAVCKGKDLLIWRKTRELDLLHLAKVAKVIVVVQAASISSKLIFSKASLIISNLRTRLKFNMAGTLFYVSENSHWVQDRILKKTWKITYSIQPKIIIVTKMTKLYTNMN